MANFFVQNLTNPVESSYAFGVYFSAAAAHVAVNEFLELHPAANEDLISVVDLGYVSVFEFETSPTVTDIGSGSLELPEEGS
jgi:hypothetical protein